MPSSQTVQAQHQNPYSCCVPLGPLAQQDPDLANLSKAQVRCRILGCLFAAAFRVAGKHLDHVKICKIPGHQLAGSLLSIGQMTIADFGQWYQVVSLTSATMFIN